MGAEKALFKGSCDGEQRSFPIHILVLLNIVITQVNKHHAADCTVFVLV